MIPDVPSCPPISAPYVQEASKSTSPLLAAILHDLESCTALLISDGPKTIPMLEQLNEGILVDYDPQQQTLTHQGISYIVLKGSNHEISQKPVVSIGSGTTGREIISLDPNHSPLLEAKYQELLSHLHEEFNKDQKPSLQQTLELVSTFVREDIFCSSLSTEKNVENFVMRWQRARGRVKEDFAVAKNNRLVPVIPIDDFINRRIGVCRHESLVTAYLLDRLAREENSLFPKGSCYHVRDMVQVGETEGGHAWNLFVSEDRTEAWHVDSLWGIVKSLNSSEDIAFLQQAYGEEAISHEKARFLPYVNQSL